MVLNMKDEMTPPLIEMVEEYGRLRACTEQEQNLREFRKLDAEADALLSEIRQRAEALEKGLEHEKATHADVLRAWLDRMTEWQDCANRLIAERDARITALEAEQRVGVVPEDCVVVPRYVVERAFEACTVHEAPFTAGNLEKALNAAPLPTITPQRLAELEANERRYRELLFAVERKFPDEECHDTALRYIRNAESADAAIEAGAGEGKFPVVATPAGVEHLD